MSRNHFITLMKQLYIATFILLNSISINAQEEEKTKGLYYKISAAITLMLNENYTVDTDDDESLFAANAIFINNSLGLQVDDRISVDINAQIDMHLKQDLRFFPVYFSSQYNLVEDDSNIFLRAGYGRMFKLTKKFKKGSMYKTGLGIQFFDDNFRNSLLLGLDFTRKRFGFREREKLSSLSIFLEYRLF